MAVKKGRSKIARKFVKQIKKQLKIAKKGTRMTPKAY